MSRARSMARRFALQAVYQWQLNPQGTDTIEAQLQADSWCDFSQCELPYFQELLHQVALRVVKLDAELEPFLDRSIDALDPVEKAILRIGVYELLHRTDVPYRVVINEGVELAKQFGATAGHKYVNGILDKVAARVRSTEVARRRAAGRSRPPRAPTVGNPD